MANPKFRQVGHALQRGLIERNGTVSAFFFFSFMFYKLVLSIVFRF